MEICTNLISVLNIFWRTGVAPGEAGFGSSVVTPLFKSGNTADPNDYRGIAAGNLIPKFMSLVLLRRIMHWSATNNILSANQAGFRRYQGEEHQVLALAELVRTSWRREQDAYVLFVDFKKVYEKCLFIYFDSVHVGVLWRVLHWMGVPERLLTFLETMSARRDMQLLINGTATNPFPQTKGLPHGGVLSPFL